MEGDSLHHDDAAACCSLVMGAQQGSAIFGASAVCTGNSARDLSIRYNARHSDLYWTPPDRGVLCVKGSMQAVT